MKKTLWKILAFVCVGLFGFKPLAEESHFVAYSSQDVVQKVSGNRFLDFGIEYPINFGVHLRYLVQKDIYVRLGAGFMPEMFLRSFQKVAPSFGYLSEEEAKLISDTFENSAYLDARVVWSPYLEETGGGPYLELGVSGMFYGSGRLEGANLSKVLTEVDKASTFDETETYSVKTNTYNATVHIGYQIPFEKIKFNLEVGLIKILGSNVLAVKTVSAEKSLSAEQKESFQDFLKKKGWIFPTVSGWISFAF